MLEQLVEAWQINHRVTLKLLDALTDDALQATLSTRGGRDVARQLAHAAWFERTAAPPPIVKTIYGFKIDKLRVADDY